MMRSVPLFAGLKEKQVKTIVNAGKELSYESGQNIVTEGESGVAFYLVIDGKVEVRRKGKVLSRLGKGDFFGEMSLLDKQPRSADVVAVAASSCFGLTSWAFFGLIRSEPDIGVNLMRELVRRLRGTNKAFTE
jgi:CRP-like cAMP-binding protein